jgi:iron complex outermembrane receptor protein
MNLNKKQFLIVATPTLAILGSLCVPTVYAASAGSFLEEVVVTAQKREQDISAVPIAVSAFSGDQLEENNLSRTEDLELVTPGLMIDDAGLGGMATTFTIRGVAQSNFEDHNEGPVAIYQDGAYVSMLGGLNFSMFDTERVEVLRGPQGTLFGRNATGGLVHVISKPPTDELEGYLKASYGSYDTSALEGAISGALSDSVRGRLAVQTSDTGGYAENALAGQLDDFGNRVSSDKGGEGDSTNARGKLDIDLSDDTTLLLTATYNEAESTPGGYQPMASFLDPANDGLGTVLPANVENNTSFCTAPMNGGPFGPGNSCLGYRDNNSDKHDGSWDTPGHFELEAKGLTAQFDVSLGQMELVSITDFRNLQRSFSEDTDGTPRAGIFFSTDQDTDQFSQELRLSAINDTFKWVVGAYYLNIDGEYESDLDFGIPFWSGSAQLDADVDYKIETETWSVFGEGEFNLSDEVVLITGIRYTEDEKEFEFFQNCISLVGLCGGVVFGVTPTVDQDKEEDDIAARVVLTWTPNDDWFVYAGVTRGNKAGGFNAPATADIPLSDFTYDAEILTNYETGFKATLWDGRARVNASVFHYVYDDYQAFAFNAGTTVVFNTDAEVDGAEIEIFAKPFDSSNFEIMLGLSLLDTSVDDITLPSGRIVDGQELPNSPDVTLSGSFSNSWDLPKGGIVSANINFNYVEERETNVQNHPSSSLEDYVISNARVSYETASEKWRLAAFVRNIGDVEYATYKLDVSDAYGYSTEVYGAPRTAGIEITRYF